MNCPKCNGKTAVLDNSYNPEFNELYRKRKCTKCGHEFCTMEFEVDITDQFENNWSKHHRTHSKIFSDRQYTKLSEEQIEYIYTHYNEEPSVIAKELGVPIKTVKYHIAKCRKVIKGHG